MPKKPEPTTESDIRQQELESERLFRQVLLSRYPRVVDRRDDVLVLESSAGQCISLQARGAARARQGLEYSAEAA
jgi:hypothetical protein